MSSSAFRARDPLDVARRLLARDSIYHLEPVGFRDQFSFWLAYENGPNPPYNQDCSGLKAFVVEWIG